MRGYGLDLRERIVEAVEEKKMSKREAARVYRVGEATVYRYVKQKRAGTLQAKSPPGRRPLLDAEQQKSLLEQLAAKPDLTLAEHAELYAQTQGIKLAPSTVDNYFERAGVKRKKSH